MIREAIDLVWQRRAPALVVSLAGLFCVAVWVGLLWIPDHAAVWVLLTALLLAAAAVSSAWAAGTAIWLFGGESLGEAFRRARARTVPVSAVVLLGAVSVAWLGTRGFAFLAPLLLTPVLAGLAAARTAGPVRFATALAVWAVGLAIGFGVWSVRPGVTGLAAETVSTFLRLVLALGVAGWSALVAAAVLGGVLRHARQ
ncbi:MAG: hypothetical protein IPM24_18475 [Bryobacterales bacterium]|nr:hypothetical protein [Bryobacterales bacterium]